MTFLPVVLREMSVAARRRGLYRARFSMALGAVLVAGWVLASSVAAISSAALGQTMFVVLASIGFGYAMLAGVHATSDCLSEEKREDTLGLLFLTDLKGHDIVLGKMAAGSLSAAFALLGTVPILALAMFLGGVSFGQLAHIAMVLGNSIALSLGAGVLVSSISKNERKAMFATILLLVFLTFGPFLAAIAFYGSDNKPPEFVIFASPLYPLLCDFGPTGLNRDFYWPALILHGALAAGFIVLASRVLPRFVSDLPRARFQIFRDLAQRMTFGTASGRKAHRAALLDRNAFLWLAGRERLKFRYAWSVIGLFAGVYLWMAIQFPDLVFELPIALAMFFLIHFTFKLWLASEVCSRLIEDRRSGALELLLSTPLTVEAIAHGQTLALRRIFLKPTLVLLLAEGILFFRMFDQPRNMAGQGDIVIAALAAPSTLLLDFWCLKWIGMWLSLRGKSIERVLVGTTVRVMALPWILFVGFLGILTALSIFGYSSSIDSEGVFIIWMLISLIIPPLFAIPARFRFLATFREAATQRFDAPATLNAEPKEKLASLPPNLRPKTVSVRRKRLAWALVIALLLAVPAGRRAWWQSKLEKEIAAIEAEGFPTGLRNLGAYYPPVSAKEDAASVLKFATAPNFSNFGRNVNHQGDFQVVGIRPITNEVRAKLAATVSTNATALADFRKAAALNHAHVEHELGGMWWRYQHELFSFATVAWMQGILAVETTDFGLAHDCALTLLRYARLMRAQPHASAQAACQHALNRCTHLLERLFHAGGSDPKLLEAIASEVARLDAPDILKRGLIIQRALLIDRTRAPFIDRFRPTGAVVGAVHGVIDAIGTRQKCALRLLEASRLGIEAASLPVLERLPRARELDRTAGSMGWILPDYVWQSFQMEGAFSVDASVIARINVLQTAIAVERSRLKTQNLPTELKELAPDFLAAVPVDPFSGAPISYSNNPTNIVVYSVGIDRIDQGGKLGNNYNFDLGFIFSKPAPRPNAPEN